VGGEAEVLVGQVSEAEACQLAGQISFPIKPPGKPLQGRQERNTDRIQTILPPTSQPLPSSLPPLKSWWLGDPSRSSSSSLCREGSQGKSL
jgi:hypothetical protein